MTLLKSDFMENFVTVTIIIVYNMINPLYKLVEAMATRILFPRSQIAQHITLYPLQLQINQEYNLSINSS